MAQINSKKERRTKKSEPTVAHSFEKFPIVGIGASAGGLEAILQLFAALPSNTDLAFVIVQHLDPHRETQMAEILSRITSMTVHLIKDGEQVKPNHVYVIPPGHHLVFSNGTLNLLPPPAPGPTLQMSIDFFFESLAKNKKSDAIGIVLSGTGSDGTLGLKAIQSEGGITFAEDPESARHDGMPKSAIQSGSADYILSPKGIAEELVRIGQRPYAENSARSPGSHEQYSDNISTDEVLHRIFFLVRNQTHIDFSAYKLSTIQRRIQRQMKIHKIDSLESYATYLQSHPEDVKTLCEDMFIHVTEFFRDPDSFQSLKETIFPRLFKNLVPGAPLRIWVPGCSTGEEAYSLAISLAEFLGSKLNKTPIQIFATDISEPAVQHARTAVYSVQEIGNISVERREKFFDKTKDGFKIKKEIRDLCVFSRHNVASNPPFAKIDLISCRNVLIYFAPSLQKQVMPVFHYALKPEGFLWLGKSESPSGFSKLFSLIDKTNKIYAKINTGTPMSFRFPTGQKLSENVSLEKKAPNHFSAAIDTQKEFDRIVMSKYAPAGVVINSDMEIIQIRGRTAPFLELATGQPNYNILKMVLPELLPAVRMIIRTAMKQNTPARKEGLTYQLDRKRKKVSIEVIPVNSLLPPKERQYVVLFEDVQEPLENKKSEKKISDKPKAGKKSLNSQQVYISQLLEELDSMRDYHQSLAEGYESTQEELTSANEELQSTNEELQSTNEELETAKEELQAANEELTTINEELQTRNHELSSLNIDLAREKLYVQLFEAVVEAASDATTVEETLKIFLDRICAHEKWAIGHAFLIDKSGKWISTNIWYFNDANKFSFFKEETEKLEWSSQKGMLSAVLNETKPLLIADLTSDTFFQRKEAAQKVGLKSGFAVPVQIEQRPEVVLEFFSSDYRGSDNKMMEVMSFMSPQLGHTIERKRAQEIAKNEAAQKSAVIATALDCIISMDENGIVLEFNPAAENIFGYKRSEAIGQEMAALIIPQRFRDHHRKGLAQYQLTGQGKIIDKRLELSALHKDGSEFPIELTVTKISSHPSIFTGFIRDITDKKRAEEVLRRSHTELENLVRERTAEIKRNEERFRLLVDGVKDYAIFFLDPNGVITTWNEGARRLKGYRADEIIGKHFSIFYPQVDLNTGKPQWELERATAIGRLEDEGWRLRKDGSRFWANVIITRINDEKGNLIGFSKITRDLTDRKKMEDELRLSRNNLENRVKERTAELESALNARDEFLSIASHELKTPLTTLKLQLQIKKRDLAKNKAPSENDLNETYDLALRQVNSLADLVEDLLDTSRIRTGNFILTLGQFDLSELTQDIANRFAEQLKVAKCPLELDLNKALIGCWDHHRIEQVIVNLISNAIKYAPHSAIAISTSKIGDKAILVVKDSGPGIPKENQTKIFEIFERANGTRTIGGLGLGLFIVKKIAEAHQGTIKVESEEGHGAKFILELPLNPKLSNDKNADKEGCHA